ncbi:carbamoyl-phosphate synthase large subunit [Candidatus Aerophobetes bacterium]|nr:carbamoyl-phosphate synthase large subunit [Candidatus Aerophobetes bacterium]
MPKRTDIEKILIVGSGPIVIGQACEFDYSGSQACKALREEGYHIILVNSNPATIMTDPEMADRTYIEPLTPEFVEKIIEKERPDAILPTLGGQTGLNITYFLKEKGVLDKFNVEAIGASTEAIARAESRKLFKDTMQSIGLAVPKSGLAYSTEEGFLLAEKIDFPLILRPAFTLGGTGGSIVYNREELKVFLKRALDFSPVHQVLIEESVIGWKEIEFEIMRDCKDNIIIVCSMENIDPMGVHTGDSAVVAPAQTLSTTEYNNLVDSSKKIIRAIGITGGGANIQYAVNPDNGDVKVIEVNPRVSRSSALASKATGFPIARVAAKLAVGLSLDEIRNDITGKTYAFFEPTLDYCVFKICRFAFEKFPGADPILGTSMKAVGEAMAIGRTFKEALQKGIRSTEADRYGFGADGKDISEEEQRNMEEIRKKLIYPNAERFFYIRYALQQGMEIDDIYKLTRIDRWFIHNMKEIVELENLLHTHSLATITPKLLRQAKEYGFSDIQLAYILRCKEEQVREKRMSAGIEAVYKLVDTCAGEVNPDKPYFYSTYETIDESRARRKKKVIVLGGGPNRIGQGIEFDYCCCHAAFVLREEGYEPIMINCNPETVSTDYDTSDRLYFEPLTREDVLNIIDKEKPDGIIVQFGGQTPLNLAIPLKEAGVKILGTSPESIDRTEDRKRFRVLLKKLNLLQAEGSTATSVFEARKIARKIEYPVLVRPSYVLGGRAMELVYDEGELNEFMQKAVKASPEHPVLIDKFLEDAIEVDVDCVSDANQAVICGIMEHIEEAGIHSGDSACAIPPYTLSKDIQELMKQNTYLLARELKVKGLMNVQYAVKNDRVYVLEVNPRASRTIPYVSKATGVPWAKVATKVMLGKSLKELGILKEVEVKHFAIKEAVFPFNRFPGVDTVLGPEMKSTGEVMGIDESFGVAFMKSQIAAGQNVPLKGNVFVSVKDKDKRAIIFIVKKLVDLGFSIVATSGTAEVLRKSGIEVQNVFKIGEGRPDVMDLVKNGEISLIINTPSGKKKMKQDEAKIRSEAVFQYIPVITTISGAQATVNGIEAAIKKGFQVKALQDYYEKGDRPLFL